MASPVTSTTTGTASATSTAGANSSSDPLGNVDVSSFVKLMIAELQHQDPLNPMDNTQMMQEMGQLETIDSTQKLTTTLNSVLQGQSFATAASLIGKQINGLDDNSNPVTGTVDKVTVSNGDVKVQVGDSTLSLSNISDILPAASN